MQVTIQDRPATPPTREELQIALNRYQKRIPAQQQRVIAARAASVAAKSALEQALAEEADAETAQQRLSAYIAELTAILEA